MHDVRVTLTIVRPNAEQPHGYISATASYPPRPGEDWERGRDLTDGVADESTLAKILDDIRAILAGFGRASDRDIER